ncbi:MAG: hypothetical protein L0322_19045, partial [Chloroflexi bacterium]|nr:hypothetical protein [Chloroflexota bacterium]
MLLRPAPARPIRVAVAKGARAADSPELAIDQERAEALALADPRVARLLAGNAFDFLYAVPLGQAESASWRAPRPGPGCQANTCAHVTFYDYTDGGTVEAVVELASGRVVDAWADPTARPGASQTVLPHALAVAAADPQVTAVLGEIKPGDLMMVPMSAWLAGEACHHDWCVDLTFLAPDGSGRVFHVLVNMETEKVARVFYTRGRPDRAYTRPTLQGPRFENGCHEQYDWNVCWEMTAHDGLNFSDATYDGRLIFRSAKVGQVEAWYATWPGGYRDEIGFRSSVPPHLGTLVNDLGDGFEVRQLYTEFLRWPNCICCYRYEQVIRFFANGAFELRFVSHGPGCDDLSIYRPFWRIDLELDNRPNEAVWTFTGNQWQEMAGEEMLPLFQELSPGGEKLFTASGDLGYYWRPVATDPLGLDEGRLFMLRWNENEGDGPIHTGPADTFQPPAGYLDGQPLASENVVLWYVPILKTKKSVPYWCVPDPEPAFSPCEAILRVEPTNDLPQPSLITPIPSPPL